MYRGRDFLWLLKAKPSVTARACDLQTELLGGKPMFDQQQGNAVLCWEMLSAVIISSLPKGLDCVCRSLQRVVGENKKLINDERTERA